MRPLIVLVLVLVAATALALTINLLGDSKDPQTPVGPAGPSGQTVETGERGSAAVLANPEQSGGNQRGGVTAPIVERGEQGVSAVQLPGQGNSLVGSVHDEAGAPIADARVRMSRDPMMGDALAMQFFLNKTSTQPPIETRSDANGRYEFRDIAPARDYYVAFQHVEFSQVQESHVFVGEQGEFRGPEVVLTHGSHMLGYVRDVGGNPVPEAVLHLDSAYNMTWDQPNPDRLETVADVTGFYEFKNIPAGPRSLLVESEGYGSQVIQNRQFKGTPEDRIELDVQLDVGHPIIGTVVGPGGIGVPDAHVVAVNFQNQITSRGEAVSDETGAFQISDLRNGSYILMVTAKGYTQARRNRIAAGKLDVIVELQSQACVNGRVLAAGAPVSRFTVEVRRSTPNPAPGATLVYEQTDIKEEYENAEDGRFDLCRLDGGYFVVVVTAPGHAPTQSDLFQVVRGTAPPPLTILLSDGGSISGRVTDPSGAPLEGAVVSSHDSTVGDSMVDDFLSGLIMSLATERKTRTDAEGNFTLRNLTPANYRVIVKHSRFTDSTVKELNVSEAQQISLGDLAMKAGGTVSGKVIDQSSLALTRGFVTLMSTSEPGVQYQVRTDASGLYEFVHVLPGSYKLSATRSSPTSSSDAFQAIIDQQASEVAISVGEGELVKRDLNLGN